MAFPTMWSQKAMVCLSKKGAASDINYQSLISTIDIDEGDKDIEETVTVAGGRLVKIMPQTLTTVTFEAYPVGLATTQVDNLGFSQQFNAGTVDPTPPLTTQPTHDSDLWRVAILWTNAPYGAAVGQVDSAIDEIPLLSQAYRWYATEAYITSNKKSFTDGGLKFTITMKCPQFSKAGTALTHEQEADGTALLPVLTTPYV